MKIVYTSTPRLVASLYDKPWYVQLAAFGAVTVSSFLFFGAIALTIIIGLLTVVACLATVTFVINAVVYYNLTFGFFPTVIATVVIGFAGIKLAIRTEAKWAQKAAFTIAVLGFVLTVAQVVVKLA